jgi:hypothetical protein
MYACACICDAAVSETQTNMYMTVDFGCALELEKETGQHSPPWLSSNSCIVEASL